MVDKTKIKKGTTIRDNDPRTNGRTGEILQVEAQGTALVRWSTGRETRVSVSRIGSRAKTGYSVTT